MDHTPSQFKSQFNPQTRVVGDFIRKYGTRGPRYTSYPTAPNFVASHDSQPYHDSLAKCPQSDTFALYIHIPFCAELCTYCACHKVIRKQKGSFTDDYVIQLAHEMELICQGDRRKLSEIHFGGGTPTFLSSKQLKTILDHCRQTFDWQQNVETSIEVDPRTVNTEDIHALRNIGFNRISFGVQDFDANVQRDIHRIQSFEQVESCIKTARQVAFSSINADLIYGLPFQTLPGFAKTLERVKELAPDRIALYSFAYLPKMFRVHGKLTAAAIPKDEDKLALYLLARENLVSFGYQALGLDHFALSHDALSHAHSAGRLHRNFMGYTTCYSDHMIGLGVSAISCINDNYFQNEKGLVRYANALAEQKLPLIRHKLSNSDDRLRKQVIMDIMCRLRVDKEWIAKKYSVNFESYFERELPYLKPFIDDGLLHNTASEITVTEKGQPFIRNISMCFDAYLEHNQNHFSSTV